MASGKVGTGMAAAFAVVVMASAAAPAAAQWMYSAAAPTAAQLTRWAAEARTAVEANNAIALTIGEQVAANDALLARLMEVEATPHPAAPGRASPDAAVGGMPLREGRP